MSFRRMNGVVVDRLVDCGWSKLKVIAPYVESAGVGHLLQLAKSHTVHQSSRSSGARRR